MTEEDTFNRLKRPSLSDMILAVKAEARVMREAGIKFVGASYWDDETLDRYLRTQFWTLKEYREKMERHEQ